MATKRQTTAKRKPAAKTWRVVIEREESGAFSAYVPGVAVYAAADTRAKVARAIRSALEAHLTARHAVGDRSMVKPTRTTRSKQVTIRTPGGRLVKATLGPDVDLDKEVILDAKGRRLTTARVDRLTKAAVKELHAKRLGSEH